VYSKWSPERVLQNGNPSKERGSRHSALKPRHPFGRGCSTGTNPATGTETEIKQPESITWR
jgi:hypothetical protein